MFKLGKRKDLHPVYCRTEFERDVLDLSGAYCFINARQHNSFAFRKSMPSVLFVCTANRFRSPFAAASFRRELASRKMGSGWRVSSAGTWTTNGLPATDSAVLAARRLGLDLAGHLSRPVNASILQASDLIIVMERGQREALCSEFPGCGHKVYLLSWAADGVDYSIPDTPTSLHAGDVLRDIDQLICRGFDRICALAAHP